MANQVTKFDLRAHPSFFLKASRKKSQYGQIFWQPYSGCELTVITGKQLSTSAVIRNRLKRQWTATSRQVLAKLDCTGQVVLQPYRRSLDLSPTDRAAAIKSLIESITVTKNTHENPTV